MKRRDLAYLWVLLFWLVACALTGAVGFMIGFDAGASAAYAEGMTAGLERCRR